MPHGRCGARSRSPAEKFRRHLKVAGATVSGMTPAPAAAPYARQEFDALREARRRIERRESGLLALVSVLLGLGQLALIGWLDSHVERGRAVAIEGTLFLLYMALVGWLLWRMLRRVGAAGLLEVDGALDRWGHAGSESHGHRYGGQ